MKTTDFELSKKLAEIGFKKTSTIAFFSSKCGGGGRFVVSDGFKDGYNLDCYSFDLETILEALQENFQCDIKISATEIEIENKPRPTHQFEYLKFWEEFTERKENESLADTAARLLILLKSKNLISFEVEE
jgi:hypothetical protein